MTMMIMSHVILLYCTFSRSRALFLKKNPFVFFLSEMTTVLAFYTGHVEKVTAILLQCSLREEHASMPLTLEMTHHCIWLPPMAIRVLFKWWQFFLKCIVECTSPFSNIPVKHLGIEGMGNTKAYLNWKYIFLVNKFYPFTLNFIVFLVWKIVYNFKHCSR